MYEFIKRTTDILGALIGLIFLAIFSPFIILAIKLESRGPIFYTPERVGKDGRLFRMFKFRSMYMVENGSDLAHAEELLKKDRKLLRIYKKHSYKIPRDPRVTKVGRFLRKSSLDEWPQFINILKGEMSVVGPRAYMSKELKDQQKIYPQTEQYVKALMRVKPGITGPWQVSGRSNISFTDRVKMDASYALRKSTLYDLLMIAKTFPAVLMGRGAT